jgi:hypothetical protein
VVFLASLAPVANLLPLYFRFADRYAAIALFALAWPCGRLLAALQARAGGAALLVPLALVPCELAVTRTQAAIWADSAALWTHASRAQPRAFFAHAKLGETLRTRGQWSGAVASYLAAIKTDPESALGYLGLFATLGAQAASTGRVPAGAPDAWEQRLRASAGDPAALAALVADIERAGCPPCARSLQWFLLRLTAHPDPDLLRLAEASLAAARPEEAVVYLLAVRDRSSPAFVRLYGAARARAHPPFEP